MKKLNRYASISKIYGCEHYQATRINIFILQLQYIWPKTDLHDKNGTNIQIEFTATTHTGFMRVFGAESIVIRVPTGKVIKQEENTILLSSTRKTWRSEPERALNTVKSPPPVDFVFLSFLKRQRNL